jgi:formate hydrogenlyase subunit 3/multisubunit Na+/H+ antiporter MnhD subunit
MFATLLFAFPLLASLLALIVKDKRKLDILILLHALLHLCLGLQGFIYRGSLGMMDDMGLFIFLITSLLFMAVAFYRIGGGKEYKL